MTGATTGNMVVAVVIPAAGWMAGSSTNDLLQAAAAAGLAAGYRVVRVLHPDAPRWAGELGQTDMVEVAPHPAGECPEADYWTQMSAPEAAWSWAVADTIRALPGGVSGAIIPVETAAGYALLLHRLTTPEPILSWVLGVASGVRRWCQDVHGLWLPGQGPQAMAAMEQFCASGADAILRDEALTDGWLRSWAPLDEDQGTFGSGDAGAALAAARSRGERGAVRIPAMLVPGERRRGRATTGQRRRVSLVMTHYNMAPWVGEALQSVAGQTRPPDEVVLVDDGSPDPASQAELDRLERLEWPWPFRLIRQTNQGVISARRQGAAATTGDWVVFLDADDALLPTAIEAQAAVLERHPEVGAVSTPAQFFGETDPYCWNPIMPHLPWMLVENCACVGSMLRREALDEVLVRWNREYRNSEDWVMWTMVLRSGWAMITLPRATFRYRVRKASRYHTMTDATLMGDRLVQIEEFEELYGRYGAAVVRLYEAGLGPATARRALAAQEALRTLAESLSGPGESAEDEAMDTDTALKSYVQHLENELEFYRSRWLKVRDWVRRPWSVFWK